MPHTSKSDLASSFGTFRAGAEIPDGAVPDPVLVAWSAAGLIEAAVAQAPEEAVTEAPEAAVAQAPEARARTRKAR